MTDGQIDGLVPMPDNWQALREALDAGPDEGPWVSAGPSYGAALPVYCNEVVIDREGDDEDTYQVCIAPLGLDAESTANMNYIAAAHPAAIRALLDERDRLAKEVERMRADAERYRWRPMRTAPKDGTAVLVLVDGSDIPRAVGWISSPEDSRATAEFSTAGWYMTWDSTRINDFEGPRYWMRCPDDPDDETMGADKAQGERG